MRSSSSWLPVVAASLVAGLGIGACGGATSTDLFDPGGGTDASTHPDTTSGDHDSSTPPPRDSGLASMPDTAVQDTSPPDTTAMQVDSSPPEPGLSCGAGLTCNKGQYCCATSDPTMTNPTTYACMGGSQTACTATGGTPVTCDVTADCPGAVCCGTLTVSAANPNDAQYTHVKCESTCDTTDDRTFCDPNANPDVCSALGMMCGPSTILPGFSVCQ